MFFTHSVPVSRHSAGEVWWSPPETLFLVSATPRNFSTQLFENGKLCNKWHRLHISSGLLDTLTDRPWRQRCLSYLSKVHRPSVVNSPPPPPLAPPILRAAPHHTPGAPAGLSGSTKRLSWTARKRKYTPKENIISTEESQRANVSVALCLGKQVFLYSQRWFPFKRRTRSRLTLTAVNRY